MLPRICRDIESRYEITFLEIGADRDHVHFLIPSVPTLSPSGLAQIIKSLTARELSRRLPSVEEGFVGRCLLVKRVFHQHGGPSW